MYNPFRKLGICLADNNLPKKPLISPEEALQKVKQIRIKNEEHITYSDSEVENIWNKIIEPGIMNQLNKGETSPHFAASKFPKGMASLLIKHGKKLGWSLWQGHSGLLHIDIERTYV